MMPDLGRYALVVGWSYAMSLALLAGIVAVSLWQARRARRDLAEVEARMEDRTDG